MRKCKTSNTDSRSPNSIFLNWDMSPKNMQCVLAIVRTIVALLHAVQDNLSGK